MDALQKKYQRLRTRLAELNSVLVAYSGGVDSALVLKVAHDALGPAALAVTADSPSVPRRELETAARIARQIGAAHLVVRTAEFTSENYLQNPANRCYFCKTELYTKLTGIARTRHFKAIANGTNADDPGDYRPGLQAADEFRVVSPLLEADLHKQEVRALARQLGLEIWDKPASPCLSSRIPYGSRVTPEKLAAVEAAENFLKDLGLRELRVRHFGATARIEVPPDSSDLVETHFGQIRSEFQRLGFQNVEIAAFRSGNLNESLHHV